MLVAAIPLTACDGPTKHADMAECEMKARKVYPHQAGNETVLGEAGDYTVECMEAKGYVLVDDRNRCPPGRGWVGEIDENCYRKP